MAIFAPFEILDWFSLFHTPSTPLTIALKHFIWDRKRRYCNRKKKTLPTPLTTVLIITIFDSRWVLTLLSIDYNYDCNCHASVNQALNPLETIYYLQLVNFQLKLFVLFKLKARDKCKRIWQNRSRQESDQDPVLRSSFNTRLTSFMRHILLQS